MFTLTSYRHLLQSFLDAGYTSVSLQDINPKLAHLFLRHDVDFNPTYCLPLAKLEKYLGIKSVYYFMVSSPFYNIMSEESKKTIKTILNFGHEIGLHFDATNYQDNPELGASQEAEILSWVAKREIDTISFHRPAKSLVGMNKRFAGMLHTYQPEFIDHIGYISDSTGKFRYGGPTEAPAFQNRRALQLLIHPIWWYKEEREDPDVRLEKFLKEVANNIRKHVINNYTPWQEKKGQ